MARVIRGTFIAVTKLSRCRHHRLGVLLVQMLNMLEAHDLAAMGYGSAQAIHTIIDAQRRPMQTEIVTLAMWIFILYRLLD